jgi:uncharacterized protein YndB with AHSA1/START domain
MKTCVSMSSMLVMIVVSALSGQTTGPKMLQKEVVVDLPLAEVWNAWTTNEGLEHFIPEKADVELKPGGKYEWYMSLKPPEGQRGSEGCKVLSYLPMEMLSFEWNFPPKVASLRDSGAHTQVNVFFDALDKNKTRVRLYQHGWQEGSDWDQGYAYFDRAWGNVLKTLKTYKPQGVEDRKASPEKSWLDGEVKVTNWPYPERRQDFETEFDCPVDTLWKLLSSTEGFAKLGGKSPLVELKPGGAYSFWDGAPNKVMAFLPGKMLAASGSAPPQYPNVRKGGTWAVYFFEPISDQKTKLRLSVIGWKKGDEWDNAFKYFNKNNPIFFRMVQKALADDTKSAAGPIQHEALIAAPVADVWDAMTTKEGVESWMVAHAEIDLRVGGRMLTHYDANGVIGDENTIENTILSFDPQRMLSIKATKPPAKFPFKEALKAMWTVIYFEPVDSGHTRVICRGMGFGDDEQSQKMRGHFEKGNAWTIKKLQEKFAAKEAKSASAAPIPENRP